MKITDEIRDILNELMTMGIGEAALTLNEMIGTHIDLNAPIVELCPLSEVRSLLAENVGDQLSIVDMEFEGVMTGNANLIFPVESAVKLVKILTGEDDNSPDFDSMKVGTINEVGNIILNAVMAAFGNMLEENIDYQVPTCSDITAAKFCGGVEAKTLDTEILYTRVFFSAENVSIKGSVLLMFSLGTIENLVKIISQKYDN